MSIQPVLVVHGGAGDISDDHVQQKLDGVRKAAKAGHKTLLETGNVLDAVVSAVKVLEDLDGFNAGRGAVFTSNGDVELEAQIIEGKDLNAGCVSLLRHVKNPIELARFVMEKSPHTFLAGDGAEDFADQMGLKRVKQDDLKTNAAALSLANFRAKGGDPKATEIGADVGTVGAVAIDAKGHVASATSTGGIIGKYRGRIGDTPLLGSGGYADDKVGTVSTTGYGESIMKYNLAHRILTLMSQGKSAQAATEEGCQGMTERVGNTAGAITISKSGEIGISFTSKRMSWAYQLGNEMHYGVDQGQHLIDQLE